MPRRIPQPSNRALALPAMAREVSPTAGAVVAAPFPRRTASSLPSVFEGLGLLLRRLLSTSVDHNYESHVAEAGTVITDRLIPEGLEPDQYSDILKFSNCRNVLVQNSTIAGGTEDAIDVVRGANYTFRNLSLVPNRNAITVKGSVDGVLIENVTLRNHGTDVDLEFGQFDNYWYVGRPPTREITIKNVNATDGKPVVIRLWDAATPTVVDSNVKIVKVPKLIWWPYFVLRAIQTRGSANIGKPVHADTFIPTLSGSAGVARKPV